MLQTILGCIILDSDGERIASRYYGNYKSNSFMRLCNQLEFEKQLYQKGSKLAGRNEAEAIFVDEFLCLVYAINDICIYLISKKSENELILLDVINCIYGTLLTVTVNNISKKSLFENLDSVHLILDEVVDESGIILETDPRVVYQRIRMQGSNALEETSFNQAFTTAKENIMRSFL
ncbi:clathrin adaptor complex small chain family protein [Cryptosporidium muris RN66]|uniref:Coatomer subunit zeta n=1 Tax=Cryptosporidium muris (strain RN66) TaxID=441375 RepID=B6AEY8_CRYMR|nr:clathrin adaptor complex small chain family protein [Cryptosporidium muris RN66]EEA06755.1 clathrin adaptor complex small chain family protein [Cryptosporidium muris RN66]|eukprot:XP_002141104.1 clathrin adaptor complex small chain family protein [Cryptosporidium muris RN66]